MPWALAFLFLVGPNPAVLNIPPTPVAQAAPWTQESVKAFASTTAKEYGLNVSHFLKVLELENSFNATGQSNYYDKNGMRERSFGACQINIVAHPGITQTQAEDPDFCIPWMAEKWQSDQAYLWSGWCLLYGTPSSKCPAELLR